MRSNAEISAEIAELQRLAPLIRQTNAFGESNRDSIDAQIRTLTERIFDDDALAEAFLGDDDDDDRAFEIEGDARIAAEWATGDRSEKPSTDWLGLVR